MPLQGTRGAKRSAVSEDLVPATAPATKLHKDASGDVRSHGYGCCTNGCSWDDTSCTAPCTAPGPAPTGGVAGSFAGRGSVPTEGCRDQLQ